MQVCHTIDHCRAVRGSLGRLALVPTMGALHEGHLSLIRRARELADHVAVSIFVNPTQFAPHEDFDEYPRPIEDDLAKCETLNVELVFNPSVDELYPAGALDVTVDVPALGKILEGEHRPHFLGGVCRVVAKLLEIVRPDIACFGQKDYQQLKVIEAMVRGLCMPVMIEGCPTMREADGLAMSSRNVYLDADQRQRGLSLSEALDEARQAVEAGQRDPQVIQAMMTKIMLRRSVEVDYAVVRDAQTLLPLGPKLPQQPVVLLVAGRVDHVRLIDNRVVG